MTLSKIRKERKERRRRRVSWTIFPGLTWIYPEGRTWDWFLAALANSISVLET